ncbi:MAG: hypothetical protein AB1898_32980 [Acidobacteriota bacterium]
MRIERRNIPRREVIEFYIEYDRRKKGGAPLPDLDRWPWDDPDGLDRLLRDNKLKGGVLPAYRTWCLVEITATDLLECAVENRIFPGESQALSLLVLRGRLAEWTPRGSPSWWHPILSGTGPSQREALILRPSVRSEEPAHWYAEDGSGRSIALLLRILRNGELERKAWAYVGHIPDERAKFIRDRPELRRPSPRLGEPAA